MIFLFDVLLGTFLPFQVIFLANTEHNKRFYTSFNHPDLERTFPALQKQAVKVH